MIVGMETTE